MKELIIGAGTAVVLGLALAGANVVPIILIGAMLAFLWHLPSVRAMFGRQKFASPRAGSLTFDDIGGQQTAKQELQEALQFIREQDRISALGIRPLRGILLTGPPGTGKTLLAKAAARQTGSAFLSSSGSEFVEMYAGVGAQRIRDLFKKARTAAQQVETTSTIVFIDEIEVLAGRRGRHSGHLEYDQTLNQLLVEMDGITTSARERVLVIAATNRVDLLDSALMRPGRFDRIVNVGIPDRDGRLQILKLHTRGKPLAGDVDLEQISRETFGFSGAHLESVTNEAAILAMRQGKDRIEQGEFLEAIDKVILGERLERRPADEEMYRIAVHEVGHAVISELVRPESVSSVTVASRGNALGYVRQAADDDHHLQTADDLTGEISMLVAGAAAERMMFGDQSTGSIGDFRRATELARRLINCGLSDLGIVDQDTVPPGEMYQTIRKIIGDCIHGVEAELNDRKPLVETLTQLLTESEKLSGEQLRRYISENSGLRAAAN